MSAVRVRVQFERGHLDLIANFLDGRGDDRSRIFGMPEFQMHSPAYIL